MSHPFAVRTTFPLALAAALLSACVGTPDPAPGGPAVTEVGTPIAGWEGKLTEFAVESPVPGIASRNVYVLLPPGYGDAASADRRYPVLYMQDGQNCLDHDPFGHGGWQVHTVSYDLVERGLMAPAILVLVHNTAAREQEYVPGAGALPGATADGYLDFLEQVVVAWVDGRYRTIPDASARAIGGSSYGGLISLYAGWTRPAVFGIAMAMSPSLWRVDLPVITKLPVRVYLDSGTVDWGGGDDGLAATSALADLLVSKGWTLHVDLEHAVGQGHNHSEEFWRARLRPSTAADLPGVWPGALPFLFPAPG
ncbi:MAG TPA: alpha/beta hydrolase-fold protein [Anaeromyxobacteraceae bacterium]|nr:alpha/beta hydrolase-fold protein [Anaeromyxobacteraceae bacterium]